MGEQFRAAAQIFINDFARHLGPINLKHDQIGLAFEKAIEHSGQLVRICAVDEPFSLECLRRVVAADLRFPGFDFGCDMVEILHSS